MAAAAGPTAAEVTARREPSPVVPQEPDPPGPARDRTTSRLAREGGAPGRPRTHPAVWCATAALGLLLCLWAVAVPMYRAVDEPQHLSTALRLAEGGGYPRPGAARLEPAVAASYPYADFPGGDARTFVPPRQVVQQPPHRWPSYSQFRSSPVPAAQVGQADQMTQHPPAWPLLTAAEIRLFGLDGLPANDAFLILRLLQALLLLPLPWLIWRTALLLGASSRGAAAAANIAVAVPQLSHIGASITDGDLLLLESGVLTLLLVKVALGNTSLRLAAAAGALTAAALLTKSFALLFPPVIGLAYLVAALRTPRGDRGRRSASAWPPAALALATAALGGGWWYVIRYAQTGSLQPSGYPAAVEARLAGTLSAGEAASTFFGSLVKTSWQDLGWLETPAPFKLALPPLLLVAAAVIVALAVSRRRLGPIGVALTPFLLLVVGVSLREISTFRQLHAVYGAQGRYLFPGLIGVGGAVGLALSGRRGWPVACWLLPLACVVPQVLGLHEAWAYFWRGGLRQALEWSPIPGPVVAGAAALALAALFAGAGAIYRDRPGDPAT